ncbi:MULTISPECIES: DUF423 domain-containing protein [unclassified Tolypothrix]|uniref:DUF423 domain-containing protein n=1 Tax=unclassified Tolypothrix TaxID=2649714 RepID=UPI0005EAAE25|nr:MULTISPECIES: DUF423 domain-containing protein [unclassified Tolypothrix]BAY94300.1 hypothetical protein NIES3275_63460 [Microchaete diplosiphon NIES-3275]EKF03948.1 hypothetical protein FDUTEX481_02951 [Tolypothrix sp. PCC 7601]MBE9086050.1 DUF423 domain-containing protein [Tolypothrix sp. LEGE 11397]UYD28034.1 DUF423 domain-containing protein [Tolypothrix sp. PCC 7712]UYD36095.1 DUF423 domain-containing protein [Tolypothrix sp. PCC 7601]
MTQIFLSIAAILGGLSVAGGAFGAHALREKISERSLEIFDTGTRYQMYHALALLIVALLLSRTESPPATLVASGWLFIIGIAIFSGSLYALSLTGVKSLGAIAPIGGAAFIAGWGALAIAAWGLKF